MAKMDELAQTIATAATGKEVRGAIAEGFGQFDQVKGEVFRRVKALEDDNATLSARVDKIEKLLYGENPQLIEGDQGDHEPPNPHVVEITS